MAESLFKKTSPTTALPVQRKRGVVLQDNRRAAKGALQLMDNRAQVRSNNTGLPDKLKSGIENLSGMSMDHVQVHYNSAKPAQLQAHAYAQGNQIHVGPGQEKHLPHEAWHVVQQAQGRVKPTMQMKTGVGVNDDVGLEREADQMGGRANSTVQKIDAQFTGGSSHQIQPISAINSDAVQLFAIGMVPANPGNWRHYTNLNAQGGNGGGWDFSAGQKTAVRDDNRANAAGAAPVLVDPGGGFPMSDSTQGALMTAAQANIFAPQVDHIVEAANFGANDLENARLLSQGEKNGHIGLGLGRPAVANQRMRTYEQLTIAAGVGAPGYVNNAVGVIARYDTLNLDQIKTLARYAGGWAVGGYGALNNGIIGGIGAAAVGAGGHMGDVTVT